MFASSFFVGWGSVGSIDNSPDTHVLHIEMGSVPVYFEHHILLWKDPKVTIGVKSLAGTFKRILSGMPIFMTEAHGPGHIAFSRDGVGHVWGMHLKQGEAIRNFRNSLSEGQQRVPAGDHPVSL